MRDNSLGKLLKECLLVNWWRRLGGEQTDKWQHPQTTSNCCTWKLPYICGHDSPIKWNRSRWLIK